LLKWLPILVYGLGVISSYLQSIILLETSSDKPCANGYRGLQLAYYFGVFHIFLFQFQKPFLFRFILNSYPSVDSFLFVGGLLLGYLTFKQLDKTHGFLNIPLFYLHRILR